VDGSLSATSCPRGKASSERKLRISIDDQDVAAENTTDYETLTLNGDHSVFLVEDCHSCLRTEAAVSGAGPSLDPKISLTLSRTCLLRDGLR
jgi:hypothetical protein